MFRIIRQLFTTRQTPPQPDKTLPQPSETLETTLVYVRVKPETKPAKSPQVEEDRFELPQALQPAAPHAVSAPHAVCTSKPARRKSSKTGSSKSLAKLGIFSAGQISLLRQIGCRTDRQLLRLTPQRLKRRLTDYLAAQQHSPDAPLAPPIDRIRSLVRRGRWAIRFANHFDDMTPRESLLLRAVHRGSRETLSRDSAGMIRRDFQRLALSSRGKRLVTLDQIPDLQRVNDWVTAARDDQKPAAKTHADRVTLSVVSPSEDSQTDVPMVPR